LPEGQSTTMAITSYNAATVNKTVYCLCSTDTRPLLATASAMAPLPCSRAPHSACSFITGLVTPASFGPHCEVLEHAQSVLKTGWSDQANFLYGWFLISITLFVFGSCTQCCPVFACSQQEPSMEGHRHVITSPQETVELCNTPAATRTTTTAMANSNVTLQALCRLMNSSRTAPLWRGKGGWEEEAHVPFSRAIGSFIPSVERHPRIRMYLQFTGRTAKDAMRRRTCMSPWWNTMEKM
jgi:hypothetical protein